MTIVGYFLVYLASLVIDCIPIFAPPAWMAMLYIMLKFDLNPWFVLLCGSFGTSSGRFIYCTYIVPWIGKNSLNKSKQGDLDFVGQKLSGKPWSVFTFSFLYSVLPLSTTALFTVVGLAKVKRRYVFPGFFLGGLIGDGTMLFSGKYAIRNLSDFYEGSLEPKSLILMGVGLLIMIAVLFIDWRKMIESKKLVFKLKFWQ
ncbi:MAG: hypothetical protein K2P92_02415 [Bdellovibrionaceae bacterium]|nr:hypothetical protein [Pseudobdellovibrionaceae bacterium]